MRKVTLGKKARLRRLLYLVPGMQRLRAALDRLVNTPDFDGWGMQTHTSPPWHQHGEKNAADFLRVHQSILGEVISGEFTLSQFQDHEDIGRVLGGLMWRHYLVFWTARYAAQRCSQDVTTLVECGVCDGLTASFAMKSMTGPFRASLYDAWAPMPLGNSGAEAKMAGGYDYLELDVTKRNLNKFANSTKFIQGYIPQSFSTSALPENICWLHIDLNAASPTKSALELLYDRMCPGAVVLFDDYAWPAHLETREVVDVFFSDKPGSLLPFPTGQAVFFRA